MAQDLVEVDPFYIKIGDETFHIFETPKSSSELVKRQIGIILGAVDLEYLLIELSMVGQCLQMARAGVTAYPDLKLKIRSIEVNITKLCDRSAVVVASFRRASGNNLSDLKATYHFLLDGMEDMAIKTLQSTATNARGMANAAAELAKSFDEESGEVEEALKDTTRIHEEKGTLKKSLEERVRKHELEQMQKFSIGPQYETKVSEVCQWHKAISKRFTDGKENTTAIRAEMERCERSIAALQTERRALENINEWAREIQHEYDLAEAAITSLCEAIRGLKKLSSIMRDFSTFWMGLEAGCEDLGSEDLEKMIKSEMEKPKEERIKIWISDGIKTKGLRYCACWVALDIVCEDFIKKAKQARKDLYDNLNENMQPEDASQTIKELASTIIKIVKKAMQLIADRESRDQTKLETLSSQDTVEETFIKEIPAIVHTPIKLAAPPPSPSGLTWRRLGHDSNSSITSDMTQQHENSQLQSSSALQQQHIHSSNSSTNRGMTLAGDRSLRCYDVLLLLMVMVLVLIVAGVCLLSIHNNLPPRAEQSTTNKCHEVAQSTDVYLFLKDNGFSVADTYNFGLSLTLEGFELDNLIHESGGKSDHDFFKKVVNKWYQKTEPPACWETVYEALKKLPNQPLAYKLKQKYMK